MTARPLRKRPRQLGALGTYAEDWGSEDMWSDFGGAGSGADYYTGGGADYGPTLEQLGLPADFWTQFEYGDPFAGAVAAGYGDWMNPFEGATAAGYSNVTPISSNSKSGSPLSFGSGSSGAGGGGSQAKPQQQGQPGNTYNFYAQQPANMQWVPMALAAAGLLVAIAS